MATSACDHNAELLEHKHLADILQVHENRVSCSLSIACRELAVCKHLISVSTVWIRHHACIWAIMRVHALQVASAVADLVQFRRSSLQGEVSLRSLQAAGILEGQAPATPHTPKRGWFFRGASPAQARAQQPSCSIQA